MATYNKIQLWATERAVFTPGDRYVMFGLDGFRIGVLICYDAGFPEHSPLARAGADLIVCPSAFARGDEERRYDLYFPQRALENTVYVAVANAVGEQGGLSMFGAAASLGPGARFSAQPVRAETSRWPNWTNKPSCRPDGIFRTCRSCERTFHGHTRGRRLSMAPRFPQSEFQRRLATLQQAMADRGLDACVVHTPENICYLTGHETPGYYTYQCLLVPVEGEPVLLLREAEVANGSSTAT